MPLPKSPAAHIQNPVTGDRITFLNAADLKTNPAGCLMFICDLPPMATGAPTHRHRRIHETFEVLAGEITFTIGTPPVTRHMGPGESVDIPPGVEHAFRNGGSKRARFKATVTPGAQFETFLRVMYGLASEGRTASDGRPLDLRALALTLQYADLRVAGVPVWIQTALVGFLAWLGRLSGMEKSFQRFASPDGPALRSAL